MRQPFAQLGTVERCQHPKPSLLVINAMLVFNNHINSCTGSGSQSGVVLPHPGTCWSTLKSTRRSFCWRCMIGKPGDGVLLCHCLVPCALRWAASQTAVQMMQEGDIYAAPAAWWAQGCCWHSVGCTHHAEAAQTVAKIATWLFFTDLRWERCFERTVNNALEICHLDKDLKVSPPHQGSVFASSVFHGSVLRCGHVRVGANARCFRMTVHR